MLINRTLQKTIEDSLTRFPVVGLLGPRQVGKTTLAKRIRAASKKKVVYLDLELPSDLNKLLEPELYLTSLRESLVIIDEVQRMPALFPLLRALVDQHRESGRFLLLGSASPALIKESSESLAGRVIYHELTPFSLREVGYDKTGPLWLRGGYPDSFLALNDKYSMAWREAFVKTYVETDLPQLGIGAPTARIRRFWTMLAHINGQLWNASQIAQSLGVSAPTVRNYLDVLDETFVVRQLQPFHANVRKRLIKSPKVYIRDCGLLHALLRIGAFEDLLGHPALGHSWEGFIVEQISEMIPSSWQMFFYRTSAGAEIDLLLVDDKNNRIAIEIKYSSGPRPTKGFWTAYDDLGCTRGLVVYPGETHYPIRDDVWALPARDLALILE